MGFMFIAKKKTKLGHFIMLIMLDILLVSGTTGAMTEKAYWKEICWSLYWLSQGRHPDRDSDNILYVEDDLE